MSRLIAKILLTVFMIPFATIVYMVSFVVMERSLRFTGSYYGNRYELFVLCGLLTWAVIALYWLLIWRGQIKWTSPRISLTVLSAIVCAAASVVFAKLLNLLVREEIFSAFVASVLCPVLWLISTVFVWRESAEERAGRVAGGDETALTCPVCGYNLTGLSEPRCPECGTKYTLSELFARQPRRAMAAQDDEVSN